MKEIWKDIEGYEGLYQVSNLGRVKSVERDVIKGRGGLYHQDEKILSPGKNNCGYLYVILYKNGKQKTILLHRLVASVFLDNANNLPQVNHKDEDKTNNCADNLEYCDRKYNCNYGTRNERSAETRRNYLKMSKTVYQYSLDGTLIREWESTNECGRNGYNNGAVVACCNNKFHRQGNNIYKDYIWTYTKKGE